MSMENLFDPIRWKALEIEEMEYLIHYVNPFMTKAIII